MNRGYFKVTKELIDAPIWHEIAPVINANFREVERKEVANGLIEFHGYSDLFTITPIEGASQQYVFTFQKEKGNDIPKIIKCEPV